MVSFQCRNILRICKQYIYKRPRGSWCWNLFEKCFDQLLNSDLILVTPWSRKTDGLHFAPVMYHSCWEKTNYQPKDSCQCVHCVFLQKIYNSKTHYFILPLIVLKSWFCDWLNDFHSTKCFLNLFDFFVFISIFVSPLFPLYLPLSLPLSFHFSCI